MKITTTTKDLNSACTALNKVICKSSLPILSHVLLVAADSKVTLTATDLEQTLTVTLPDAITDSDGELCIALADLKLSGNNPAFIMSEGEGATLTVKTDTGDIRKPLSILPAEDYPMDNIKWSCCRNYPVRDLLDVIRVSIPFASIDATRYVLNGVYVDVEEQRVIATDGRRLNSLPLPEKLDLPENILIPSTKILKQQFFGKVKGDGYGQVLYSEVNTRIRFILGNYTYTLKLIDGLYPNYKQVIPDKDACLYWVHFNDADIQAYRETLESLPAGNGTGIEVYCARDTSVWVMARPENALAYSAAKLPDARHTGPGDTRFALDRDYLMAAFDTGVRAMGVVDHTRPVYFNGGDGVHVIMTMRTDEKVERLQAAIA